MTGRQVDMLRESFVAYLSQVAIIGCDPVKPWDFHALEELRDKIDPRDKIYSDSETRQSTPENKRRKKDDWKF